jgi:hypothetical protein
MARRLKHRNAVLLIKRPEYRCETGEEGRKLELGKNNKGTLE